MDGDSPELNRRRFMQAGVLGLAALPGGSHPQLENPDNPQQDYSFRGLAHLIGADAAKPTTGSRFYQNKTDYAYLYTATDSDRQYINQNSETWTEIPTVITHDILTATNTVENTTTQTDVFTADLPANSLTTGRVYELTILGAYSTANSSDTFTLEFTGGGTTIASLTSVAANSIDAPITLRLTITVRSVGGNAEIVTHTDAVFDDVHQDVANPTPVTIDTTVLNQITANVAWSAADPGNSVDIVQGFLKEVG